MNIAQTTNETTEITSTSEQTSTTVAFYVNMHFNKLAEDIISGKVFTGEYTPQFNGKGRILVFIPANLESTYFYYSLDKAGNDIQTPPFEINNGDKVVCTIQEDPKHSPKAGSKASFKWKGIIQNRFDLQQVATANGKTQVTYKAVATGKEETDSDDVIINIDFKLKCNKKKYKFSVAWDPKVIVKT
jgi:hypothetical protein